MRVNIIILLIKKGVNLFYYWSILDYIKWLYHEHREQYYNARYK